MVVTHVSSFPPDPEADLKNFQNKQAEYEAAYRCTKQPFVLCEALLNAQAARQLTPDWLVDAIAELNMPFALYKALLNAQTARQLTPNWLVDAIGELIMRGRTNQMAESLREQMRHVQRYRRVRDLRDKGHSWDDALNLAVTKLEATDAAARRSTIEKSYMRVKRDLELAGHESKYFFLVARSDPTVVPVCVSRTKSGEVIVNGVVQPPKRSEGDPKFVKTVEPPIVELMVGGAGRTSDR